MKSYLHCCLKDVGQANGQQEDDLFDVKENDDARTNGEM